MANSAELATLTAAVDAYCKKHGLRSDAARNEAAIRVFGLFQRGIRDSAALATEMDAIADRSGLVG